MSNLSSFSQADANSPSVADFACEEAEQFVGRRRARASDPESSHQAAKRAERFAASHVGRILAALDQITTGTAAEIAEASGLTVVQVDRRLVECERAGLCRVITYDNGRPLIRNGYRVWARAGA